MLLGPSTKKGTLEDLKDKPSIQRENQHDYKNNFNQLNRPKLQVMIPAQII
jgi:hypothetical protein